MDILNIREFIGVGKHRYRDTLTVHQPLTISQQNKNTANNSNNNNINNNNYVTQWKLRITIHQPVIRLTTTFTCQKTQVNNNRAVHDEAWSALWSPVFFRTKITTA